MSNSKELRFSRRALIVNNEFERNSASGRAACALRDDLIARGVVVTTSHEMEDAAAIVASDASLQVIIVDWDLEGASHDGARNLLKRIRDGNGTIPVFLSATRSSASSIPVEAMQQADDFIWLLEDTPDFIGGRILAAIDRYRAQVLPPMFGALARFARTHEYSWHTPGHHGGIAFLKHPAGRAFFEFFGEELFRSDLSISVGELGSLLDHSGPIGAGERYAAGVFGAHRTYYVTNGSSTSNRVILMASVTRDQIALCDRNCHKSIEHSMTMSGAIPTYLVPTRNRLGLIGPIPQDRLTPEAIKKAIQDNPLVGKGVDPTPVHAVITNSTYDGLCYNVKRVRSCWARASTGCISTRPGTAMPGSTRSIATGTPCTAPRRTTRPTDPTVFATHSTHKLLAALSQASYIHIRDGRRPIPHERFNEAFMMHASTSPQYAIIASNDVSAAMMDGPSGIALTTESIREAVAFRQMLDAAARRFRQEGRMVLQLPGSRTDRAGPKTGKAVPFHQAAEQQLVTDPSCLGAASGCGVAWLRRARRRLLHARPDQGVDRDAGGRRGRQAGQDRHPRDPGHRLSRPARHRGREDHRLHHPVPVLARHHQGQVGHAGQRAARLQDRLRCQQAAGAGPAAADRRHRRRLCRNGPARTWRPSCSTAMRKLKTTENLAEGLFAAAQGRRMSPVEAYESLVKGNVETLTLDKIAGRSVATGIVPYPPGIPILMPGEEVGAADGPILGYLKSLEAIDRLFPGFGHDTHGVENHEGTYRLQCLRAGGGR